MGPFFALGHLAGLEPWVIQRLWIGTVSVAAFTGIVLLADRLGIGSPWSRIAAGLGYAASPAALTLIGGLSSEFLPAAMAPWILVPLVRAAQGGGQARAVGGGYGGVRAGARGGGVFGTAAYGGGRVRAAARSAVAVACCGGI